MPTMCGARTLKWLGRTLRRRLVIRRILVIALVSVFSAMAAYVAVAPADATASASKDGAQPTSAQSSGSVASPSDKGWIGRSNEFANLLIEIDKKHSPESASHDGLSQYDDKI